MPEINFHSFIDMINWWRHCNLRYLRCSASCRTLRG